MFGDARALASELLAQCRARGIMLAAAESCTGGLVAALLTEIPGSSDVFERGFVTYSNASKSELLGVPLELIAGHGAVSYEVAEAMARGALTHSKANLSVAVTGIAGPGGGTWYKPVGLVFIAVGTRANVLAERNDFHGSRADIREQAVIKSLIMLLQAAKAFSGV